MKAEDIRGAFSIKGVSDQPVSAQSVSCCSDRVTDIHVHVLSIGDSGYGCRASEEFIAASKKAFDTFGAKGAKTEDGLDTLLDTINNSRKVGHVILHAMDGVYKNGRLSWPDSQLIIPNDFVRTIAMNNRRVLFGASVHPYRDVTDALLETDRCICEGAALFQWVPSIQRIDPEDRRCIPFYMRLAREGVPLLCHTGNAFDLPSLDSKNITYNSPSKMRRALDIGVKVIISHGSHPGNCDPLGSVQFLEFIELMKAADQNRWDLYADTSRFLEVPHSIYFEAIKREIADGNISPHRLLFGSGFPMSAAAGKCPEKGNPLDYCCDILLNSGLHDSIATNAAQLFASHIS